MAGFTMPWMSDARPVDVDSDDEEHSTNKKVMEDLFADFNAQVEQLKGRAAESRNIAPTPQQRVTSSSSRATNKSSTSHRRRRRAQADQQPQQAQPRVVLESRISHNGRTVRFESELSLAEDGSSGSQSGSGSKNKWGPRKVLRGRGRKQTEGRDSTSTKGSSSTGNSLQASSAPISFASFKKLLNPLLGQGEGGSGQNNLMFDLKMWWANDEGDETAAAGDGRSNKITAGGKSKASALPWSLSSPWKRRDGSDDEEEEEEEDKDEQDVLSGSNLNATFGRDKGYSMDADFEVDSPMHSARDAGKGKKRTEMGWRETHA
jgi:hypothetical protein